MLSSPPVLTSQTDSGLSVSVSRKVSQHEEESKKEEQKAEGEKVETVAEKEGDAGKEENKEG